MICDISHLAEFRAAAPKIGLLLFGAATYLENDYLMLPGGNFYDKLYRILIEIDNEVEKSKEEKVEEKIKTKSVVRNVAVAAKAKISGKKK
ncbi:MAG: hypothetical protein LBP39_02260 [Rickettsiales bacterium]|nr:hypothetical protein [Rickettsiales bacterium]